jgi:2-polyprenyl-3-methyl-5-hydroxy-6-metoxy-1,4-benzoquinol methylase
MEGRKDNPVTGELLAPIDLTDPLPPVDEAIVDKWDREWMHYLATEGKRPHLIRADQLSVICDIAQMSRAEVFSACLTATKAGDPNTPLHVWALGAELVGKRVVEIGCGAGALGKQLGLIVERYLGIDASRIALAIARGSSPPNCQYFHLDEREEIRSRAGAYDTMIGREFFIHQNYENARWVLALGRLLLRQGGVICADFYRSNPQVPQGVLHPARSQLDANYASCAFVFSTDDLQSLANETEMKIASIDDDLAAQRRFVVFTKP